MDGRRFDDVARLLATSITRRAGLRRLAPSAAAFLGLGVDRTAAACTDIGRTCDRTTECCERGKCIGGVCDCHPQCRANEVCSKNNVCCPKTNLCRNPETPGKFKCCDPTSTCVKGDCCELEKACRNPNKGHICCPGSKLCFDGVCCEPCGGDCCAQKGVGFVCCNHTCVAPCPEGKTLNPATCKCECPADLRTVDASATDARAAGAAALCCPDGQEACIDGNLGPVCCKQGNCYTAQFLSNDGTTLLTDTFCCGRCADGSPNCTPTVCPDPYRPGFDTCCSCFDFIPGCPAGNEVS